MALPVQEVNPDDPVGGGGSPGGGGNGTLNTGTVVLDKTITKDVADSDWRIEAYAALVSGDDLQFQPFITVDGVICQVGPVNQIYDNKGSKASGPIQLKTYAAGLSAGPHRVIFSIRNQSVSTISKQLTVLTGSYLEVTELKNGAR